MFHFNPEASLMIYCHDHSYSPYITIHCLANRVISPNIFLHPISFVDFFFCLICTGDL